ncbi:hypothetical protein KFE25_012999 [Diacronema lutheri]|uniref:Peptidase M14 domain-containing protein n=1 Tax=Diacronema lutheri TaxID=2081491 RepID=A0A8J5X4S2_DIALT|nr:hypothetical protein KFE25_012999 [Diacronema lutheri]
MAPHASAALLAVLAAHMVAGTRRYTYPTYAQAVDAMRSLASHYPSLVKHTTAQGAYGLGTAGTCRTRTPGTQERTFGPCLNHILHITNRQTLPDPDRPDILFLGGLHGDERIGPVSTIELARFLADAYATTPWVRRLVDGASIWIVPLTNAVGYETNTRLELSLFPNRDFGYVQQPERCMTTIAGRTVNELFRRQLFQIVVTFHGGMTSIGYPWGSFNHHRNGPSRAPDDAALVDIARSMSAYASTGGVDKPYPYGTMNEQVYPVHGGMEDWGYAASFDRAGAVRCAPRSHGGYAPGRSDVTNASARALVFLVEAGPKRPRESTLGSSAAVLTPGGPGDGHVPRNIRLALTAIDFLRPHVELLLVEPTPAGPGRPVVVRVGRIVRVAWRMWGATRINRAELVWRASAAEPWATVPGSSEVFRALAQVGAVWASTPAETGAGTHELCVLALSTGAFALAVRAQVDDHWGMPGGARVAPANMPPQSHLARARTDRGWAMANGEQRVVGRTEWLSAPVEVRVGASMSRSDEQPLRSASAPFRPALGCAARRGRRRVFGGEARRREDGGPWPQPRGARRDGA